MMMMKISVMNLKVQAHRQQVLHEATWVAEPPTSPEPTPEAKAATT